MLDCDSDRDDKSVDIVTQSRDMTTRIPLPTGTQQRFSSGVIVAEFDGWHLIFDYKYDQLFPGKKLLKMPQNKRKHFKRVKDLHFHSFRN